VERRGIPEKKVEESNVESARERKKGAGWRRTEDESTKQKSQKKGFSRGVTEG